MGHPGKICRDEICIGRKIDESNVDHELYHLKPSDPFFPPDTDTARALEVVPVHNDVDNKVKGDNDP